MRSGPGTRHLLLALFFVTIALLSKIYRGAAWRAVDAYAGDAAIVASLFHALSALRPAAPPPLRIGIIAAVALLVELFQATEIPVGWNLPRPWSFILGSRYDIYDFFAYALGLSIAWLLDCAVRKRIR
jgi:hypothetical protein